MTIISMIAAVDHKNGLGINNQLLCHLPADLQHFKNVTYGKPIIMGRKTFESIGKPLPGRLNIIISRTVTAIEGTTVVDSLEKAMSVAGNTDELMIIGGEQLFNQAINNVTRIYLTRIHHQFTADVFFPTLDEREWICIDQTERQADEKNQYNMTFFIYERR